MVKRWWIEDRKNRAHKEILELLPKEPHKIQSHVLFDKAKEKRISPSTVWKHLKKGIRTGSIRCIEIRPKEKYYQRTSAADLELELIDAINLYSMTLGVIVPLLDKEQKRKLLEDIKQNTLNTAKLILRITGKTPKEIKDLLEERGALKK